MTNTGASSAGWPGRPTGVCSPKPSTWSGGIVEGMSGVQIGPGATLFTRIPREASRLPRDALKLAIPALVTEYGISVGFGWSELTDDVLMIEPPGCMCGSASLQSRNIAVRFTS